MKPHDQKMQKLIGEPIEKIINSNAKSMLQQLMELQINTDHKKLPHSIEDCFKSELSLLRTVSALFSTFDRDVFIYFITQFFAQSKFNNYVKIAPCTEIKFDKPFAEKGTLFNNVVAFQDSEIKSHYYMVYLPQYVLGSYKVLPYTSTSEDLMRNNLDIKTIQEKLILLGDSESISLAKVKSIILETPVEHRNRLISDLLSFFHILINKNPYALRYREKIQIALDGLSTDISKQILDKSNTGAIYIKKCGDWLLNIEVDTECPFHITPYFWDEIDWNENRLGHCVEFIQLLLKIFTKIID